MWVLFAFALFSSNSWKPLASQCKPFLHEKGKSAPTRIIVQIPLMESYDLQPGTQYNPLPVAVGSEENGPAGCAWPFAHLIAQN